MIHQCKLLHKAPLKPLSPLTNTSHNSSYSNKPQKAYVAYEPISASTCKYINSVGKIKSKVFIKIIKVAQLWKQINKQCQLHKSMSANVEVNSFPWYWSAKGKHTESIIFQTAQQMNLCPWTNKKYGLEWYWHFNIRFSETQKQTYKHLLHSFSPGLSFFKTKQKNTLKNAITT